MESVRKMLYTLKKDPIILEVPKLKYITIEGQGNPNKLDFQLNVEALYAISYAIKMSYKKPNPPMGYVEYTVYPLEGEWDLIDKTKPSTDKDNYQYKLMIQQPDFVNQDVFKRFYEAVLEKKDNPKLKKLQFEEIEDGLCCQIGHIGPFENEPQSFEKIHHFLKNHGLNRVSKKHKEIYLSDPRKTEPSKLKTLLRVKIQRTTVPLE